MKHKVNGYNNLYFTLYPYVTFFLRLFYRQYKIIGFEKIPKDKPIILAPNHQNAFMDAIVFIPAFGARRQLSYLVRASIFGSKLGDFFLHKFHMLPVYRQVDGVENLGKNDVIFENCIFLMENKRVLTLFPEGTHHLRKQMLPLKKGVTRIALAAEERHHFNLDIQIFPAGIYYSRLSDYGGNVLVQFGNPIRVKEYEDIYKENPNKVHNLIRERMEKELSTLMIDIRNNHYYDCIELCRLLDANELGIKKVEEDFKNSKKVIRLVENLVVTNEEKALELKSLCERYQKIIAENEFRDVLFSKSYVKPSVVERFLFLLISPLGLYGWINNLLPFLIPNRLAEKKIKDPGFRSSIKAAASMFTFFVFYLLQTTVSIFLLSEWWMVGVYFLSLPLTFFIGVWWRRKIKRFTAYGRWNAMKNMEEIRNAVSYRKEIIAILNSLQ